MREERRSNKYDDRGKKLEKRGGRREDREVGKSREVGT